MKFTRNEVLTGSIIGTISFALLSGTAFDLGLMAQLLSGLTVTTMWYLYGIKVDPLVHFITVNKPAILKSLHVTTTVKFLDSA